MRSVKDYAKFFLKHDMDTESNTFDGNMKLQKLLFFANLINYSKNSQFLFGEKMLAFENGTVIEEVRQRYKTDYYGFKKESKESTPVFSEDEYEVLEVTMDIFGKLSARELSDINHQFGYWREKLELSTDNSGYRIKELAKITEQDVESEIDKVTKVVDSYYRNKELNQSSEIINGVVFYYRPSEIDLDSILPQLEVFTNEADEDSYTISVENDTLVIV